MIQKQLNNLISYTCFLVFFNIAIYKHTRFYEKNENATHRIYFATSSFHLPVGENCERVQKNDLVYILRPPFSTCLWAKIGKQR